MKSKIMSSILILFLVVFSSFHSVISEELSSESISQELDQFISNTQTLNKKDHMNTVARLVPVTIKGHGYICSTAFYVALIPMIFFQFFYFFFELIGLYPNLLLIEFIFQDFIPDFCRNIAESRDTFFPLFFSAPMIHVNQHGGTFMIGSNQGRAFNGALYGFTGIAWEKSDGRIEIKGFALRVKY